MTDQPEVQPSTPVADHRDLDDHTPKKAGFMKAENIIRMVQTVLLTAVAGFAISVVVAGHWWETPAPPPPPPPTVNVKSVGDQVVGLLREQWNGENLQEYGIAVDDGLSLINTDLNKYDGLATVHTRAGHPKVPVGHRVGRPDGRDVLSDGRCVGDQPHGRGQEGRAEPVLGRVVLMADPQSARSPTRVRVSSSRRSSMDIESPRGARTRK